MSQPWSGLRQWNKPCFFSRSGLCWLTWRPVRHKLHSEFQVAYLESGRKKEYNRSAFLTSWLVVSGKWMLSSQTPLESCLLFWLRGVVVSPHPSFPLPSWCSDINKASVAWWSRSHTWQGSWRIDEWLFPTHLRINPMTTGYKLETSHLDAHHIRVLFRETLSSPGWWHLQISSACSFMWMEHAFSCGQDVGLWYILREKTSSQVGLSSQACWITVS